jgi:hypothetical protein
MGHLTPEGEELSSFITSYIPTTAAAVTRAADVATMPTAAWFNTAAGTLVADGIMSQINTTFSFDICGFDDATISNCYIVRNAGGGRTLSALQVSGGTVAAQPATAELFTVGVPFKAAMTYNAGTITALLNGGSLATAAPGAAPALLTRLNLSALRAQPQNGWKSRIRYWPRALSAAELQQVTT